MLNFFKKLGRDEKGVSALEYAILAAVVLGAIILGLESLDLTNIFDPISDALDTARGGNNNTI